MRLKKNKEALMTNGNISIQNDKHSEEEKLYKANPFPGLTNNIQASNYA